MTEIEALATAITKTMLSVVPVDVDLWGPEECAAFFKCSKSQFIQYIKTYPEFPKPIRVPLAKTAKGGKPMHMHERWKAVEVIEYANRCKVL